MTRFCRDCKHHVRWDWGGEHWCEAPQNVVSRETSLVTGEERTEWWLHFCKDQRTDSHLSDGIKKMGLKELCGSVGRWFTPKDPAP